jgi:DNA-binding winged helix-turn-helix (wHTH) protein/TolB-like protein
MESGYLWRFGDCEFDELRRQLRVGGAVVELESKPLDVLRQLLLRPGEVLTKEELLDSVWPGVQVVDSSLATAISKLRKALGDENVIVTLPRVGYRLAVPVHRKGRGTVVSPQELSFRIGDSVPGREQWRLSRRLNHSPASEVWVADHQKTRESRVFKFASDGALSGLKREVTLARLLRESLGERREFVRVLEWNFTCAPYFVETEYVGPNLAEWAEQQGGIERLPMELRLRLIIDVARAVGDAHRLDILHKDLKPGNILISTGAHGPAVTVADFGSATLLAPERLGELGITNLGFTQTGSAETSPLTGSVLYVAPEVIAGQSYSVACDVYALGVLLYQLIVGDFRRPLAPGWEADVDDPLLREDVAAAASGDPTRRLQTASDLANRLLALDRRRMERAQAAAVEQRAELAERRRLRLRARRPWLVATGVAVVMALISSTMLYRGWSAAPPMRTLAVLPFDNVGSDTSIDFLRLAVPDEIATALTRIRGLGVRPFATTSRYQSGVDIERTARELGVDGIVTGRFMSLGSQLHITLEAIDPVRRQSVWRDTIDVPARSLVAAQIQIALRVRHGLAPAFGGLAADTGTAPRNDDAYELYLRSVSLPFEAGPNAHGVAMLEQAVALDPTYAPAWFSLSRRYYVEARYGDAASPLLDKFRAAAEHAMTLDADYVPAVAGVITSDIERGEIVEAHEKAADLVRRRPDSIDAQFVLSYVLRFAGVLEEAGRHCEAALLLDPHTVTSGLRSCAIAFYLHGDYARAKAFLEASPGAAWNKAFSLDTAVREGRLTDAVQIGAPHIPKWPTFDMLVACVERKPIAEIVALLPAVEVSDDPEQNYLAAAHLAYCGRTAEASDLLRRAIKGNYCSYPSIDSDPLFVALRARPDFAEIRESAVACQRQFLAGRN